MKTMALLRAVRRPAFLLRVLLTALTAVSTSPALAETLASSDKLTDPDGLPDDNLGYSVAVDGDTAVVGVPGRDGDALGAGAAHVFVRSGAGWVRQAVLTPTRVPSATELVRKGGFGYAVAISGDTALVGDPYYDRGSADDPRSGEEGIVYVFVRVAGTWVEQDTLLGDNVGGAKFGSAVAISGDTAIVGAPSTFGDGNARVFARSAGTWSAQARLFFPFPHPDYFPQGYELGCSVALHGDTAILGTSDSGLDGPGDARVYVRSGTTWTHQANLLPATRSPSCHAVALSGETAMVGQRNVGAHVFVRNGSAWSEQATLLPGDGLAAEFGTSVALSGDTALVGAYAADHSVPRQGAAYAYTRIGSSWSDYAKLVAADPSSDAQFGASVALSGRMALVGAPRDDERNPEAGAGYALGLGIAGATPNPFQFTDRTDVTPGEWVLSNYVRVTGISAVAPLAVSGGQFQIGSGAWTGEPGWIANNAYVRVRHRAALSPATQVNTALTVGNISDTFTSTTLPALGSLNPAPIDTQPDPFHFADQLNVPRSATIVSAPVAITGITAVTRISISGGSYRINGGSWTTEPGVIANGDRLEARHTSDYRRGRTVNTVVTIEGTSDTFSSTTTP